MTFETRLAHEAACTRLEVAGPADLGRLLSLLQVLALDSAAWPRQRLLIDLRRQDNALDAAQQQQLAEGAAATFPGLDRIAFLTPPGRMREAGGTRVFLQEDEALRWLAA